MRTRLTLETPGLGDAVKPPEDPGKFDVRDPANVSPFVAYLASEQCAITGETFIVQGGRVQRVQSWTGVEQIDKDDRWTVAELAARAGDPTPGPARRNRSPVTRPSSPSGVSRCTRHLWAADESSDLLPLSVAVCIIDSMRRPRHGGTSHPPLAHPGNGFGRPLRPGPLVEVPVLSDEQWRRALECWAVDVDLVTGERGEA